MKGAAVEARDHKVADDDEVAGAGAVADQGKVYVIEGGDAAAYVKEKVNRGSRAGAEAEAEGGR